MLHAACEASQAATITLPRLRGPADQYPAGGSHRAGSTAADSRALAPWSRLPPGRQYRGRQPGLGAMVLRQAPVPPLLLLQARQSTWKPSGEPLLTSQARGWVPV